MSNSDRPRPPRPAGTAYTGETIAMPRRREDQPRPAPRAPQPVRRRSTWRLVRRVLLGLLVLGLVGLGVLYIQIHSVASQIVVRDVRPNPPIASPLLGGTNLLIVGVDERPDHPEEGVRSDTLIVLHLDPNGRWASMLSIPRDTRATIPSLGESKINTAYGQGNATAETLYGPGATPHEGGMALVAQTVEQLLQLPQRGQRIDAIAQINFDGFAGLIDALGGISIDVPQMDGQRALIYARTRHSDSDFGRAERQQQVLRAIAAKIRERGTLGQVLLAPKLLGSVDGTVETTLPIARLDTLAGLIWIASGLSPDQIGQTRLSPETAPNYREEGADLSWDPNDVRAVVDAFLTRPSEAAEQATVQVLNGTESSGLAGRVSLELDQAGFTMTPAGNAPATDAATTIVYDVTGKPRTSQRLARLLKAELRQGAPPGVTTEADIVVIAGSDQVAK